MTNHLEGAFLEALQSVDRDDGLFLLPALCVLGILLILALVFEGAVQGPNRGFFVRSSLLLCLVSVAVCGKVAADMLAGTPGERDTQTKARLLSVILVEPASARVLYDGDTATFSTRRPTSVLGVRGTEEIEVSLGPSELDAALLVLQQRGIVGARPRATPTP